MKIRSMGSIYHIAHKAVEEIYQNPVEITEKVDGSYFSFSLEDGELHMRSKGQELIQGSPSSKMFEEGMRQVEARKSMLIPKWIYRGEYLMKPKHNTLAYDRVPLGNVILFDIEMSLGNHAGPLIRRDEAARIGFGTIPVLYEGMSNLEHTKSLMENTSVLGGQKIEGVVVKNYFKHIDGHIMMGKLVSDQFKEVHTKEWKKENPTKKDIVETLIDSYRVPARWRKAIQHLTERGEITNSPKDIGPLLKEISEDIKKEEEDAIKEALFKLAWPQISRGVGRGFPDWYKKELVGDNESTSDEEKGSDETQDSSPPALMENGDGIN